MQPGTRWMTKPPFGMTRTLSSYVESEKCYAKKGIFANKSVFDVSFSCSNCCRLRHAVFDPWNQSSGSSNPSTNLIVALYRSYPRPGINPAAAATPQPLANLSPGQAMALHSDGGFPVTANSMPELVARSEVIVVAQVSGIAEVINMSRDQVNPDVPDPNDFEIGQIYNLTVQRYLKGGGDNAIKIMQAEGGILLNQATPSPDIIKEAKSYDNYFHVHFQTGVKYLFFLKSLKAFYGKDYFNGAIHPWVWSLPDGGNAGPLTATEYIGANFPSKPSASLLLYVQQVVSQNPTIPARPNTATLIPTTPPSNTTPAPNGNGIPAIKPNPGLAAPDAVNVPAFTEADVRQYISQVHPEWGLLRPEGCSAGVQK